MDNKSLSHTKWKCQYHIVFIAKYRKKQLYGQIKADVREIIGTLCKYKDVENILRSKQKNHEKKIQEVPLFSGPVKTLATPPFWASSNKALIRVLGKPPVELVVADLVFCT